MRKIFILFILLSFSFLVKANDNQLKEIYKEANQEYTQNKFDNAIELYLKIAEQGYKSTEIFYNLGNAYYKKKNIPLSILYYERAKRLSPNDEDILFNLNEAQKEVKDKIESIPEFFLTSWYKSIVRTLSADAWSWISVVFFLAFLSLLAMYLYSQRMGTRKLAFLISVVSLFISISTFTFANKHKSLLEDQVFAVVFSPSVTIKSSPDQSGTDLFSLHEGTKIEVKSKVGEWTEIKIRDGKVGWLKAENIIKI